MKLTTRRLVLRPVNKDDLKDIVENVNNLHVSRYLAVVPFPYGKKDALSWINHSLKKRKEKIPSNFSFVIYYAPAKCVVGAIGLHKLDYNVKKAELGYWLGEKYWGNHVMSEAVEAVLKLGFNKLKLNRIDAKVFAENVASAMLLEKFGFRREGLMKQSGFSKASKKTYDEYMYALLKSEYKNNTRIMR